MAVLNWSSSTLYDMHLSFAGIMSGFHQSMVRPQCVFLGHNVSPCELHAGIDFTLQVVLMHSVCFVAMHDCWGSAIAASISHANGAHKLEFNYCLLKTSGMLMAAVWRLLRPPAANNLQACPHVTQQLSSGQQPVCVHPTLCMQEAFGPCTVTDAASQLLQRITVWLYPA